MVSPTQHAPLPPPIDPIVYSIKVDFVLSNILSKIDLQAIVEASLLREHHLFSITDGTKAFLVGHDGEDFWYKQFEKAI
ncbi:MAG: hypothetical protein DRQ40_09775 [Gammaproteobacteria bacterium]|nr:MAG: hypothetical protein DRQ40_09775 [Gammaproteobacteria bacterium]